MAQNLVKSREISRITSPAIFAKPMLWVDISFLRLLVNVARSKSRMIRPYCRT